MSIEVGRRGRAETTVTEQNTAAAVGSGSLPVFATPVGSAVRAEAEVTALDRRKITFSVRAFDAAGPIGQGVHERFVVRSEPFLAKAQARKGAESDVH